MFTGFDQMPERFQYSCLQHLIPQDDLKCFFYRRPHSLLQYRMCLQQYIWVCPVLTSRTQHLFFFSFKAELLASVIGDIKNDGSEEESLWLKRNQTDPLPDSLSWGPRPSWFSKKSPTAPHSLLHSPPVQPHCITSEHGSHPNILSNCTICWVLLVI